MESTQPLHAIAVASLLVGACAPASSPADSHKRSDAPHGESVIASPVDDGGTANGPECVVGIWASVHDRHGDLAQLTLHYPRESRRDYAMSRYMDSFPILITPDSRAWVDTLPAPASTEPGRPALLFRDGSTDRWRVVTDGSACPGDASTDLGHLGLSTSTSR